MFYHYINYHDGILHNGYETEYQYESLVLD